jgi:hypothetical protein
MKDLTTTKVGERFGVSRQTVGRWCRDGLLPGAYEEDTGRGSVWLIPPAALDGFVPPKPTGRPPKPKQGETNGNGQGGGRRKEG